MKRRSEDEWRDKERKGRTEEMKRNEKKKEEEK